MKRVTARIVFVSLLLMSPVIKASGNAEIEEAIKKTTESYVAAFKKADAEALAAHWTDNGDYIDVDGNHLKGKETIKGAYQQFFAENPGVTMEITVTTVQQANDDLVIEDGFRDIGASPKGPWRRIRYTAVHVEEDGKWLVQSVRDAAASAPSNRDYLKDLEWAMGDWVDETEDGGVVQSSVGWSEDQNFIIRSFVSSFGGSVLIRGTQWIGWDPIRKVIRSWRFDSNGGFGEGTWERDGDTWVVKASSVLPTGQTVLETHIIGMIDANTISWQTIERTIDGEPLPDTGEIRIKRQM